jgi:hypothetical protein
LRSSTRFLKEPETDFAAIFHPGDVEGLAEVHSESLGGISLWLDDIANFPLGREIGIVHAGSFLNAVVRRVQPCPDGRWIVGLSCERIP